MTIQQALDQKVWAVIGATHKTEKFGYKIYKCLKYIQSILILQK